jgi:NADH:ubiquinone oxidoreductase subunit 5 (subunit L)/multisubunit Na+/H+ antiporter MnhA subunit
LRPRVYGHDLHWVGPLVGTLLMLAALGTAFYMSRLYYLVFSGDETRAPDNIKHHIHESPSIMVVPLVVLAAGAALIGFIGVPPVLGGLFGHPHANLLAHQLEPCWARSWRFRTPPSGHSWGAASLVAVIGIPGRDGLLPRRLQGAGAALCRRVPRVRAPGAGQVSRSTSCTTG